MPLSEAEVAELARRERLQEALGPAIAFASTADRYSGFYFDQQAGGVPVFLFAGPSADQVAGIRERLPTGTEYRIEPRDRTYADLDRVRDEIEEEVESLASLGISITAYGIDQFANVVSVGIDSGFDEGEALLASRFGEAVHARRLAPAQADGCNSMADCWPPKGGVRINSSEDGGICTSAFVARRTDTSDLVLVTAGHCLAVHGGSNVQWTHHGEVIGKSKEYIWQAFTSADVGLIRINNAAVADMGGNYRRYLSDNSPITQTNLAGVGTTQQQGFAVCRMGWTSKLDCGTIVLVGVARESCVGSTCRMINMTNEVSFDSKGGDSGGAVFSGVSSTGYDLHVHSDPDDDPNPHGWYTPLSYARSTLISLRGVTINFCVTASC